MCIFLLLCKVMYIMCHHIRISPEDAEYQNFIDIVARTCSFHQKLLDLVPCGNAKKIFAFFIFT